MDVMEEEGRKSKGLVGLLELLHRRRWLVLLTVSGVMANVVSVAMFLPNIFLSSATVLIERQQIPTELVRSTVTGDLEVRLHTISQEILSRSRLQGLIDRFGLYPELMGRVPLENVLERMRREIKLQLKGDERRNEATTVAFTLSYRGQDPQKVAAVANTLASFYIEENLKVRERQAAGTADFLGAQLEEMKQKLEQQEKQVGRFKELHIGELPQQTEANLATLEALNAQLRLNSDSQIKINERRQVLAAQVAAAEAAHTPVGPNAAAIRIEVLSKQLTELQTRYTDKYPDVVRVKAEIAILEKEVREGPREGASRMMVDSPQLIQLRQAVADADVEYKALRAEADSLRASIASYQRRVENSPRREQQFRALARDYDTTQELYQSLLRRQREAKVGESMEQRQKGETFRVIEPALASEEPAAPNRLQLILIGLLIALSLAAGTVMLAEHLDTSFHSVEDLRNSSPAPVLVSIPRIVTGRDRRSRRWRLALGTVSAMLGIALLVGSSYLVAQRSSMLMSFILRE